MPCELMFGLFSLLKECGETVGEEEENYVKMKKKERRKGEKEQERKE